MGRSRNCLPKVTKRALLLLRNAFGGGDHMRTFGIAAVAAMALWGVGACAQGQGAGAPIPPKDKATYFQNSDLQNIWKDLEAKQGLNKRVLEGGAYSINIRIVKPPDPPLLHANSLDIWL